MLSNTLQSWARGFPSLLSKDEACVNPAGVPYVAVFFAKKHKRTVSVSLDPLLGLCEWGSLGSPTVEHRVGNMTITVTSRKL